MGALYQSPGQTFHRPLDEICLWLRDNTSYQKYPRVNISWTHISQTRHTLTSNNPEQVDDPHAPEFVHQLKKGAESELEDTVEDEVDVAVVDEHVGEESPGLVAFVGHVDEWTVDGHAGGCCDVVPGVGIL